ncbi:1-phosphofructokinase family hexose kinase [Corticicoccus populi]|uniref:Tagatose-6-phosphate kinase n=1 Tax=Corticicoccus populi TaxID=1812821 RepID=A0ABW5WZ53_9STAP
MIYTITLNPAIDRIIRLKENLQLEHNNKTKQKYIDLGGKATHVSAILTQLGTDNLAMGFYGQNNRDELEVIFDQYNMDHDFHEISDQSTRESTVVINNSGGSYMITEEGLNVSENDIEKLYSKIREKVKADDIVVIAGTPPKGFSPRNLVELIQILKSRQAYIAVDLSKEYLEEAIKAKVNFIKPNEHELNEVYTGSSSVVNKFKNISNEIEDVLCTLGEKGVLFEEGGKVYQAIPPSVELKSDTGAGDAFVAGYIDALSRGLDKFERIRFGIQVSASKVQQYSSCLINIEDFEEINKNIQIIEVS